MKKTIASLALLKSSWDLYQKDYIESFVPFIVTLIKKMNYSEIDVHAVSRDFAQEYGLFIPYHPMNSILTRVKNRGYIRKNGKYIPVREKIITDGFADIAIAQERKYQKVINQFILFCKEEHGEDVREEQADQYFIGFLKEYDLDILFATVSDKSVLPKVSEEQETSVSKFLVNSFIVSVYNNEPELFEFIVSISVGHVMASTILDDNHSKLQGKFNGVYYLDTGLLFSIMGIDGVEYKQAFIDFISLLKTQGAQLCVFSHTYKEFVEILENSMVWIENKSFDLHKASRTLLYFLEQEKTSSDVELFIAKIDQRLRELKIAIVETPSGLTQGQEFLVNEDGIYGSIVKVYSENNRFFDKDDKDHTIKQDVKSICATYRLRQGRKPRNLKDVECIFITTNPSLARAAKQFEIEENGGGKGFIPTVLTDIFVGTIVWLNTPVAVMKVNEKRLIANCYAALQPSKDMIRMLVEKAEKMNDEGEIRDEDVALLKISRVARNILQKNTLGDLERFDNVNISAIVRQTRLDIRNEERESFENDREEALHKVRDAEAKVALAEKERKARV
ncbi:hypothetical protein HN698_07480 [Candidatus Woesearchaeota archaeon]|nr:hypothetical protein [Candidatus Woesearchaeota archaeon]